MTTQNAMWPFPARIKTELQIDPVLLSIVLALLMGGFVILASASISISDNAANNPFFYVQRQLVAAAIGAVAMMYPPMIPLLGVPGFVINGVGTAVACWILFGQRKQTVPGEART